MRTIRFRKTFKFQKTLFCPNCLYFAFILFIMLCAPGCTKNKFRTQDTFPGETSPVSPEMMTHIATGFSTNSNPELAVKEAVSEMRKSLQFPGFVTVYFTGNQYDGNQIFKNLRAQLGHAVYLWGLNSDKIGVITGAGRLAGLTIMGIESPGMVVGVGNAAFNWQDADSYRETGRRAVNNALSDAGKTASDPPDVVLFAGLHLIAATDIMRGIADVIGVVPMWGGNTGQETGTSIPGDGVVISGAGAARASISIAAIWIRSKVGIAYGYSYTVNPSVNGIVTKADPAQRIVYEINNRPAALVYNEWTGGKITDLINKKGGLVDISILGKYGAAKPFGKNIDEYVWVGFPVVYPDNALFVTHEALEEGQPISLVTLDSEKEFINKPAAIAVLARNRGKISKQNIAGALLAYCYMEFYVAKNEGYNVDAAIDLFKAGIREVPFNGFLSGGEIGYSQLGGNRMLACSTVVLIFSKL